MNWFLYDRDLRHERTNNYKLFSLLAGLYAQTNLQKDPSEVFYKKTVLK